MQSPSLRASVCGRCFLEGNAKDRGAWALNLPSADPGSKLAALDMLAAPDWQVRWGGVRVLARLKGQAELSTLASWVVTAKGEDQTRAELTVAHLAGERGLSSGQLLKAAGKDGPKAAAKVWSDKERLQAQMETEIYGTDGLYAEESLGHLSKFLQVPEGRVALWALAKRPPQTDPIVANVLKARASRDDGMPAGLSLIKGALPDQKEYVDRLFLVLAKDVDAARAKLSSGDMEVRKEGARMLWEVGPLGAPELERLMSDEEPSVRVLAARALAAGEGRTVSESARARLKGEGGLGPGQLLHWIDAVGAAGGKGCEGTLTELIDDPKVPPESRGVALSALGTCAGSKALPKVTKALLDPSEAVRAGAVAALSSMPRSTDAALAAGKALNDPSPRVLAAAVRTLSAQRQSAYADRVKALLDHQETAVREAAVEGCALICGSSAAQPIARRLKDDPDAKVRAAAASALGELGGPLAAGALGDAAAKDPDSRVRYLAKASLRRLGFAR